MGPSAMRIAGLAQTLRALGHDVLDAGNVRVEQRETAQEGDPSLKFLEPIRQACVEVYATTAAMLEQGRCPLVLGGDHSLAMGSIAAVVDVARSRGERVGVVWLDAHGDMNSPDTSPSGNIHGMPLAVLLGRGPDALVRIGASTPVIAPDQVALVGIRAIDTAESAAIRSSGVHALTMRDVDERGMRAVIAEAIETLLSSCDRLHVSFDVDFLDPLIAPGVGTRVRGGPNYREAHLVMEMLADCGKVGSVDVVELNPILDRENVSAELVVELLASLFGRRIL